RDSGYAFLIQRFHVKGQVIDSRGISAWGYGGQTMQRGDRDGDAPRPNPADRQNRTVDWLDHQLAARELLDLDPQRTFLVLEHEYPKARVQDKAVLAPILAGSLAFARAIDEAAAAMYALQHEVLAQRDIPIQGFGREAYRT